LKQNEGKVYAGPFVYGEGFLLTEAEAKSMIAAAPENAEVILPYLIGQDINSDPHHKASRFVISFEERTEVEAQRYVLPFEQLKRDVFPIRNAMNPPPRDMRVKTQWWKFFHPRLGLIEALKKCEAVCARSQVSTHHAVAIIPSNVIPSHFVIVFLGPVDLVFPLVQSAVHEEWVWKTASSLGGLNNTRYIQRDCFLTFPFPGRFWERLNDFEAVAAAGRDYSAFRREVLVSRQEGLTKTYNRFHDRREVSSDIARLRSLHAEMDRVVTAAYGWADVELDHEFHVTKQGERFTISESARREVLDRLLQLNHELYAEEERLGLHDKKGGKTKKKRKSVAASQEANIAQEKLQLS